MLRETTAMPSRHEHITRTWGPPPPRPRPPRGELHIWRVDVAQDVPAATAVLCAAEQVRAQRFANPGDRQRWVAAHYWLRRLVASYSAIQPRAIRFGVTQRGKPFVAGAQWLRFNLSHAGDTALYAFSDRAAVGIDLEVLRPGIDVVAVAERVLGAALARRLRWLPEPQRHEAFLHAWVRYEASIKCRGGQLGDPPDPSGLWLETLDVGAGAAGAVAAVEPPTAVRLWDLSADAPLG
jgi:phosphopantetheinyl transferase